MSDEPTERDVEDLALVVGSANPRTGHVYIDGNDGCKAAARAVLTSDWYAERIAQARREGAAGAWAEGWNAAVDSDGFPGDVNPYGADVPPAGPDYAPTGGPVSPFGPFPKAGR